MSVFSAELAHDTREMLDAVLLLSSAIRADDAACRGVWCSASRRRGAGPPAASLVCDGSGRVFASPLGDRMPEKETIERAKSVGHKLYLTVLFLAAAATPPGPAPAPGAYAQFGGVGMIFVPTSDIATAATQPEAGDQIQFAVTANVSPTE